MGEFVSARAYGWGDSGNIEHIFKSFDDSGNEIIRKVYLDYNGRTRFKKVSCREDKKVKNIGIDALSSHSTNKKIVDVLGNEYLNKEIQSYLKGGDIKYKMKYLKYKNKYLQLKKKL